MTAENPLDGMEPSGPETDGWEPPLPLDAGALPPFPLDCLPPWMAEYCRSISTAVQVPLDLVSPLMLAAVSAAVARKAVVEVRAEYYEALNIWAVAPLESGNRKSQCVRLIVAPIRTWEAARGEEVRDKIAEEQTQARIRAAALAKAERTAAGDRDANTRLMAEAEALTLAAEVGRSSVTATPRMLAADVTAEGLVSLLTEQDGRIAIIVAEGDIFELMAGRYSSGIPNIGHYLNAHVGDDINVDRQGRPHQYVAHPALTMGVSPQPDVMHGLTGTPGFLGRGLLNRFLYTTPTSWVGQRVRMPGIAQRDKETYARAIKRLLDIPMPSTGPAEYAPHTIYLDPAATALHEAFEDEIEPRLGRGGDLYAIQGWGSKLPGAVVRLAGVLHLALYGADGLSVPVEASTMMAATTLGRYFIPHALAAFRAMSADERVEGARHILAWISRATVTHFTKRECWQYLRRRFGAVDALDAPLALLCDHAYIREIPPESDAPRPGRPASPRYAVNPLEPVEREEHTPAATHITEILSVNKKNNSVYGGEDDDEGDIVGENEDGDNSVNCVYAVGSRGGGGGGGRRRRAT